jgi:hypothetical protein
VPYTRMRQKSLSDEPQQIGYRQKALDERKKPVGAYWHPCVVRMREIKQKERNIVPTSANYSRVSD